MSKIKTSQKIIPIGFFLVIVGTVVLLFLSVTFRLLKGKPIFRPNFEQVRFLETRQSGWSNRDYLTRWGGIGNFLWIAVTQDELWISPHFPFTLGFIPEAFHLDYRILGRTILEFTEKSANGKSYGKIRFRHATGQEDSFVFSVTDVQRFKEALTSIQNKNSEGHETGP